MAASHRTLKTGVRIFDAAKRPVPNVSGKYCKPELEAELLFIGWADKTGSGHTSKGQSPLSPAGLDYETAALLRCCFLLTQTIVPLLLAGAVNSFGFCKPNMNPQPALHWPEPCSGRGPGQGRKKEALALAPSSPRCRAAGLAFPGERDICRLV